MITLSFPRARLLAACISARRIIHKDAGLEGDDGTVFTKDSPAIAEFSLRLVGEFPPLLRIRSMSREIGLSVLEVSPDLSEGDRESYSLLLDLSPLINLLQTAQQGEVKLRFDLDGDFLRPVGSVEIDGSVIPFTGLVSRTHDQPPEDLNHVSLWNEIESSDYTPMMALSLKGKEFQSALQDVAKFAQPLEGQEISTVAFLFLDPALRCVTLMSLDTYRQFAIHVPADWERQEGQTSALALPKEICPFLRWLGLDAERAVFSSGSRGSVRADFWCRERRNTLIFRRPEIEPRLEWQEFLDRIRSSPRRVTAKLLPVKLPAFVESGYSPESGSSESPNSGSKPNKRSLSRETSLRGTTGISKRIEVFSKAGVERCLLTFCPDQRSASLTLSVPEVGELEEVILLEMDALETVLLDPSLKIALSSSLIAAALLSVKEGAQIEWGSALDPVVVSSGLRDWPGSADPVFTRNYVLATMLPT